MKEIENKFNKIILIEMLFYVVYAILGVVIFMKSEMTNNLVGILIGSFLLIEGFISIYKFIDKTKIRLFRPSLFIGIVNILLGIFVMLNPLTLVNILNVGLGIWILVEGISKFILFINLKSIKEDSSKLILTSSLLMIFMGILIIVNPFRSLIITKTVGCFIIFDSIINLNDLVLIKKRAKKIVKLFK